MKITIKTLQQKQFQIEAEGTDTIADLKTKVAESQGHAIESQKLIYAGKVLADDKTVGSCEIKEKDFLVLMVSKPKPTPSAASSSTPVAATTPTPATVPAPNPVMPAPAAEAAPTTPAPATPGPVAAPAAADRAFGDMSSFLTGQELQNTINNMIDMGFERAQVLRALKASYNNPDRAVEYLMTGIPDDAEVEQPAAGGVPPVIPPMPAAQVPAATATPIAAQPPPAQSNAPQNLFQLAAAQQQQQQQAQGGAAASPLANAPQLEALRNNPQQLAHIRDMVMQNPALLQPMIQQLAQTNPGLAQYLAQNPEALLQMLGGLPGGEDFADDGEGPVPAGAQVVHVSEEERAAIERLEALGFPRQIVIEAYFACDKNEELAANYLFENVFEDQ